MVTILALVLCGCGACLVAACALGILDAELRRADEWEER